MKSHNPSKIGVCCLSLILTVLSGGLNRAVRAQTTRESIPPLPREIERSLIHNSSQDFFQQGATQFEREIQRLREGKFAIPADLLRVREDTQYRDRFSNEEATPPERQTPNFQIP